MTDADRHIDDETLFDLIEDALDAPRAREVEAHLDACAACGARVRAALAGSPDEVVPVVQMDAQQVAIMDAALATAWRERRETIAAAEAREAQEAAVTPQAQQTAPLDPVTAAPADPQLPRTRAREHRSWGRRLVPILAFCVLAALAGTSVWLGDRDTASTRDIAGDAGGESATMSQTPEAAVESQSPSAALPDAPADEGASAEAGADAGAVARDDAFAEPPVSGMAQAEDEICIATLDQTRLFLPDGRVPRTVLRGPLGIYLVCG